MRKIVNSTYISLDGDTERLDQWSFEHWSEDLEQYANRLLSDADALLMGRETYVNFAEAWSKRAGADAFADRMNAIPKYVVSDTLDSGDWGETTVIARDRAAEEIARLKERPGGNVLMYGFGPVAQTLLTHGLLDEVHFWVHPVIAGGGTLAANGFRHRLRHTGTTAMDTGVVVLTYAPTEPTATE
ncbi:dihydrofolate reductase family protein [Streptomyces bambusae]|uniref:dihydrofolate reductase family protein n=1 Tax=Streptomyces bambusae TaxID=1550616 RepID=UPI001CFD0464|nr:dihydrofolate reductase family protein [Streptomyces bambusae]MCB5168303.1 dihydrofolate reductase family protein [Streptomyces bambusae]